MVSFSGVMMCLFYRWSNAYIESNAPSLVVTSAPVGPKKKKAKMSMTESARFLASSQYLRLIAALVVGYGERNDFVCC